MTTAIQEIPLSHLIPSSRNVRRTAPKAGIEELAASIAAHGLLQNLTVIAAPRETGSKKKERFEVVAGGRRLAALKLLAKQKRVAKDTPVPCQLREGDIAEEISLAENALQCPMHPADQFEAFAKLHTEEGMSAEDIGARFGVTAAVVKQRLKLGAVSPALMQAYREEEMDLEQLSAFAITDDHALQERVWNELPTYGRSRAAILAKLNEDKVATSDRRALFVGTDAYQAAGGAIVRDLFDDDEDGFLTDPALLDQLVREKLEAEADRVEAEGWRWVEITPAFDYEATASMRRVYAEPVTLSDEEQERLEALEAEYVALNAACGDEVSAEDGATFDRLDAEIDAISNRQVFDANDIARAGAFVCLCSDGDVRIERGFVRKEDEEHTESDEDGSAEKRAKGEGRAPLSERLVADLTSFRTAGLRDRLAQAPDTALRAVVHALALESFYPGSGDASCLEISLRSRSLSHVPGLEESAGATAIAERHEHWAKRLPEAATELWPFALAMEEGELLSLLAHCASLTLNAVHAQGCDSPAAHAHADALAGELSLDMKAYWQPTAASYFGRVSKERILDAVRVGVSPSAAENLAKMKKAAMAEAAEQRLTGSGWLPDILRTPASEAA